MEIKNSMSIIEQNADILINEWKWLAQKIDQRLNYFIDNSEQNSVKIPFPNLEENNSNYAVFIKNNCKNKIERFIIIAVLASYFKPEIYDPFFIKNKSLGKPFTQFGGNRSEKKDSAFQPTLRTLAFILYGSDIKNYFSFQFYFEDDHYFKSKNIIILKQEDNSFLNATLSLGDEFIQQVTTGKDFKPNYSSSFPANIIKTELTWDDLVLENYLLDEIEIINTWLNNKKNISENKLLSKKINNGYKCLFFGPPGTGKTLSAILLGQKNKLEVYRVDLSQVVSKYIGETEKNLGSIFDIAENKNWILFFDEAESLFSKRTAVSDSKDKFANQETAYLLQRVEEYKGLIILATNLKPNIDLAFSRRLQSVIHYPIPNATQRKRLWRNALNGVAEITEKEIDKIAKEYKISGGSIKNVIQYSWLKSKSKNSDITYENIMIGIRRELNKDGKSFEK